jgi:hypothetical protein
MTSLSNSSRPNQLNLRSQIISSTSIPVPSTRRKSFMTDLTPSTQIYFRLRSTTRITWRKSKRKSSTCATSCRNHSRRTNCHSHRRSFPSWRSASTWCLSSTHRMSRVMNSASLFRATSSPRSTLTHKWKLGRKTYCTRKSLRASNRAMRSCWRASTANSISTRYAGCSARLRTLS